MMNISDRLVLSGKLNERYRCKAIINTAIKDWSQQIEKAGPGTDIPVEAAIDVLLGVREQIENKPAYKRKS